MYFISSCPDLNDPQVKEIHEQRLKVIREDIRAVLSRFSLSFLINDEGMMGVVDTALGIDRKKIFIDELKRITQELETDCENILEEFRQRDEAGERDERSRGLGPHGR